MKSDKYFGISKRIAKWKEPSDFESDLSELAEKDPNIRNLYASYYKHLDKVYYEKGKGFAKSLYDTNCDAIEKENFENVYDDMVYCLHKYGLSFQDYISYGLQNQVETFRNQFISDKLRYYYCDILNAPEIKSMMTDKSKCYSAYKPFFKRDLVSLTSKKDKDLFLNFTKTHKKGIFKPLNEHSGHGISIIDFTNIDPETWFEEIIEDNPGVVEEIIIQGDKLNELNSSSVNTCRVITFRIDNEVNVFAVSLRIGNGDSITDNAGSGGIFASVDPETGIVQSDAINLRNQHFLFHPVTKRQIIGFKLPEWDDAKRLVTSMALHIPGTTLISWDIAYSNNGWCMVEANENGAWRIIQSNLKIGKKDELYLLMDKYFATKNHNI